MTIGKPEMSRDGSAFPDMEYDIGSANWRTRKRAVQHLAQQLEDNQSGDQALEQVLRILRDEHRDLSLVNSAMQILVKTEADVVPALVQYLQLPDPDLRCYVALTLGERGDVRAAPALIALLGDPNPNVQLHAIEAIGKLRVADAVDALIQLAESKDFSLAFPAIESLTAIGDGRISSRLISLLDEPLIQPAIVDSMGELGDEGAVEPLLHLLAAASAPVESIAVTLDSIYQRFELLYGAGDVISTAVSKHITPDAIAKLINLSSSTELVSAASLARVLSWLDSDEVIRPLAQLLKTFTPDQAMIQSIVQRGEAIAPHLVEQLTIANFDARLIFIDLLGRIQSQLAAAPLVAMIQAEQDEELLDHALIALGRIAARDTYDAVRSMYGHPSARVRQAAVAAAVAIAVDRVDADCVRDLESPSAAVRDSAVRAAALIHNDTARQCILDACSDPDPRVVRTAVEHLGEVRDRLGLEVLERAIESDDADIRAAAVRAFAQVTDHAAAVAWLDRALVDEDVWVRYFAIRSLAAVGAVESRQEKLVQLARKDGATQVRIAALDALAVTGASHLDLFAELVAAADEEVAASALFNIAKRSGARAIEILFKVLDGSTPEATDVAITALGMANHERAVERLIEIATEGPHERSLKAIKALGAIRLPAAAQALIDLMMKSAWRTACVDALVAMRELAVDSLAQALQRAPLDTRRTIVEILARIRTDSTTGVLKTALSDSAPAVAYAADLALRHRRLDSTATRFQDVP